MNNFYANYGMGGGVPAWMGVFGPILALLVVWSLFWKGLALWHSARKGQPWWFLALLVVNTAGILEIVYLFGVLKLKASELFVKK